ncbi:MAG: Na+/galactose cotransporter [Terracidiphilus sp.]
MFDLTVGGWLIVLLYLALVLGVGFAFRPRMKTSKDFLKAGRTLSTGMGSLAFIGVSLGVVEVMSMGALGAQYGRAALPFYSIGAIPAMIFAGVFMMPMYYSSGARSVPEFLKLRFDEKTRTLHACLFATMTVLSSGISIYAMARLMQALHMFNVLFLLEGSARDTIFTGIAVLLAAIVAVYVLLGGLSSAVYNQVWQFLLLVAGLLPAVLAGLRSAGGWHAVMMSAPVGSLLGAKDAAHAGTHAMGLEGVAIGIGMGFVLGAGSWCCDFRELQIPMAARDAESARRIPLFAALMKACLPALVVVPGLLAIGLPTPHTTTVVRNEGGVIYHNITIVPRNVEQGQGLVPAKINPANGQVILDASGRRVLDYDMATPNVLLHFLPTGLLGLGLTALLASFMSGIAANLTAFNTVFTCDLYQSHVRKDDSDRHYLLVGRWATVGSFLLSIVTAFAAIHFSHLWGTLLLLFSLVNAPLFATVLLGMFWKRATGHGAFAGLIAGTAVAMLHHGLTLPIETRAGIGGGWIAVLHLYPGDMVQNLFGAIFAFTTSLIVMVLVSLSTRPCPETDLVGLVHALTPNPTNADLPWWKRPESLGVAILLVAVALTVFFA